MEFGAPCATMILTIPTPLLPVSRSALGNYNVITYNDVGSLILSMRLSQNEVVHSCDH